MNAPSNAVYRHLDVRKRGGCDRDRYSVRHLDRHQPGCAHGPDGGVAGRVAAPLRGVMDASRANAVAAKHVAKAVLYRSLDRSYWS